jgi:transposase
MLSLRNCTISFFPLEFEQNVKHQDFPLVASMSRKEKKRWRNITSYFLTLKCFIMNLLRQVVGIDVAKDELVCTFGVIMSDFSIEFKSSAVFKNSLSGFEKLSNWAKKFTHEHLDLYFVMEATGVYHQQLAYWLHEMSFKVVVVLPNKISNFFKTLDIKTVTDKTASEAITKFGLSRSLDSWQPPLEIYRKMKQLTRERDQIVAERTIIKNQIHAEETEAFPNGKTIDRLNERKKLLNNQEAQIKIEIEELIASNEDVKKTVENIVSIPGVGRLTAAIVLAETNGFEIIRNKKQLSSYAGFDIKEKLSGISVKGKPKISKKGNKHVRKAMYLPSLSAVKYCPAYKEIYARLVGRHGVKMKALVCIQRKLLELMYILFKNKTTYDAGYEEKIKGSAANCNRTFESSFKLI